MHSISADALPNLPLVFVAGSMAPERLVTVVDVEQAHAAGLSRMGVGLRDIVTPLARDTARRLGLQLHTAYVRSRKSWVFGNWKANGTLAQATARASALAGSLRAGPGVECALFPPAIHLAPLAQALSGSQLALGAQDVSVHAPGAFTGEIPAAMLSDLGLAYVLVGHSERRHVLGDGENAVQAKLRVALESGLRPVLCIGETTAEREAGRTFGVLRRQLLHALEHLRRPEVEQLIVAYEPVWAIGTGLVPTVLEISDGLAALRDHLARRFDDALASSLPLLYGGSVKPTNAEQIFAVANCDGVLVGGASLEPKVFTEIIECAVAQYDKRLTRA